jgi:spiro-SPASM protein
MELIKEVLKRPALSLVIETSGIGWSSSLLEELSREAKAAPQRENHSTGCTAPISWIVSLDAFDPERYQELRGPGFAEAYATAKTLLKLFPNDSYVQAVRIKDFEDDIERFYRFWKDEHKEQEGRHIIIQKYNDFLGSLPTLQASDLSPVKRRPCWHIKRDMNVLIDGRVPYCREIIFAGGEVGESILGNALNEELSLIWKRGEALYLEHCRLYAADRGSASETELRHNFACKDCDEYYTYNF